VKVKITVLYHCGCGVTTDDIREAVAHAEERRHSMDFHGRLIMDKTPRLFPRLWNPHNILRREGS